MTDPILKARGLVKRYGRVTALDHCDFDLMPGEILAVIGDNGAGKSTLIKAISGAVVPDGGEIWLEGKPVRFTSPIQAREHGIATVFQEVLLAPERSVLQNIFLGYDGLWRRAVPLARRARIAEAALARITRTKLDLDRRGSDLPLAQQQLVVLARALVRDPRILILDDVLSAWNTA